MKRFGILLLLAAFLVSIVVSSSLAVDVKAGSASESSEDLLAVSVSLAGGNGAVFHPGRDLRFTIQTNRSAYVVVYNIDSDGFVHLLYPDDGKPALIEGNRTYALPEPGRNVSWEVGSKTGVEYIHAVAVADRDRFQRDELYFMAQNERLPRDKRFRVDIDPYLAFNTIDEELVSGAQDDPPATAHAFFYVNREVPYPRYLCAKCHSQEKVSDPYAEECPEVVIEKINDVEEVGYPYPPLYDISHVGEEESDYYSSSDYAERRLDDAGDVDIDLADDEPVYLSIYYGRDSYPYRYSSWPYGGFTWAAYWSPFWYDWGWGGWSWSWWWWSDSYYFYTPFYSYWWYHPYHYPWYWNNWHHCYGGWHCHDYCSSCGNAYRPILAERRTLRRDLDFAHTTRTLARERSLRNTRIERTREASLARRMERTDLARRVNARDYEPARIVRDAGATGRPRDAGLRPSDGSVRTVRARQADRVREYRTPARGSDRSASNRRERSADRSSDRSVDRARDSGRERDSGAVRDRGTERRSPERSTPDRSRSVDRPSGSSRSRSGGEASGSSSRGRRSDSGAERRKASDRTAYAPAPSRGDARGWGSSAGSRAASRQSSAPSPPSRPSSSGGASRQSASPSRSRR